MVEHRVSCPHCHSALKSPRPVPAGIRLKCPRCGSLFTTGQPAQMPVAAAVYAGAPAAAPAPAAISAAPLPAVPLAPAAPPPARAPNKGLAVLLVGLGALLLLGLAVGLAMFCFSRDTPPGGDGDGGSPPTQPPSTVKKPPPPLIVLTPEEEKQVTEATKRGVDYLKKRQQPDGLWNGSHPRGYTALAGLTLLECGVKADDPAVQKAAKVIRDNARHLEATYEISLAILFLNRLNDPADRARIQSLALRLVAAQTPQGGWSYTCNSLTQEENDRLLALLRERETRSAEEVVGGAGGRQALPPRLQRVAVLRPEKEYSKEQYRGGGDNSNTQFAILALWAARGHDVPLDRTLSLIVKRFRNAQNDDGSWNYLGRNNASQLPTMTCAGLLGLAVGMGLDRDARKNFGRPEDDPQVKRALEHLSRSVGQPLAAVEGLKIGTTEMYFLWSVERVAMLYQLKAIGEKKWYHWGMQILLEHQAPDGHWNMRRGHGSSDLVDTCFALLFLQRVNLAKDLTEKLEELRRPPQVGAPRKD